MFSIQVFLEVACLYVGRYIPGPWSRKPLSMPSLECWNVNSWPVSMATVLILLRPYHDASITLRRSEHLAVHVFLFLSVEPQSQENTQWKSNRPRAMATCTTAPDRRLRPTQPGSHLKRWDEAELRQCGAIGIVPRAYNR